MTAIAFETFHCHALTPEMIRDQLERLAHWVLNEHVTYTDLHQLLTELTDLDEHTTMARFIDLVDAVTIDDAYQRGLLHWSEIIPDATGRDRDEQAADACRVPVDLALDALLKGAAW